MARYPALALFVATTALIVGCEPAKELPTVAPTAEGTPVQHQMVPPRSDPDAKATIDRAVKKLTGEKPELLAKGKVSRAVLKGVRFTPNTATQWTEDTRTIAAVWPDRLYGIEELQSEGNKFTYEVWLRRPDMIVFENGVPKSHTNPAEREQNFASDEVGQHWMVLLLPPTDPKAVVFDPQSITAERSALHQVKLSLGEYPIYQLTFDAKTDALVRVEYTTIELGVARRTTMIFSDHKPGPEGFTLPYKFECRHNDTTVEKFTVEKWELPATIKDDEFSPPKK